MASSIWYVHGFGASPHSFNWLSQQLPPHTPRFFTYEVDESVRSCIDRLTVELNHESEPVTLLGHSLGGIIGRGCSKQCPNVARLVTLCAPFGGLPHAGLLSMFSNVSMFSELRNYSPLLVDIRSSKIAASHLAIVASHSLPMIAEPNDGVITVASQMALPNQNFRKFSLNHFEVLLSPAVATTISDFLG